MREIEFRAKDFNDNWKYGSLVEKKDFRENKYVFIRTKYLADDYYVEENTVGQYTGLKDKNGKKIFEGDIIKTYHGIAKVVYSNTFALFGYIMIEKNNKEKEYDYRFTEIGIEEGFEIIGNIWDNEDLLNEK